MIPLVARLRQGLFAYVLLTNVVLPASASWPSFRGPRLDGVAENAKPPVHFGIDKNLLWKIEVHAGHSSPVVRDDLVFLSGVREKDLVTLCINRSTGKQQWEKAVLAQSL